MMDCDRKLDAYLDESIMMLDDNITPFDMDCDMFQNIDALFDMIDDETDEFKGKFQKKSRQDKKGSNSGKAKPKAKSLLAATPVKSLGSASGKKAPLVGNSLLTKSSLLPANTSPVKQSSLLSSSQQIKLVKYTKEASASMARSILNKQRKKKRTGGVSLLASPAPVQLCPKVSVRDTSSTSRVSEPLVQLDFPDLDMFNFAYSHDHLYTKQLTLGSVISAGEVEQGSGVGSAHVPKTSALNVDTTNTRTSSNQQPSQLSSAHIADSALRIEDFESLLSYSPPKTIVASALSPSAMSCTGSVGAGSDSGLSSVGSSRCVSQLQMINERRTRPPHSEPSSAYASDCDEDFSSRFVSPISLSPVRRSYLNQTTAQFQNHHQLHEELSDELDELTRLILNPDDDGDELDAIFGTSVHGDHEDDHILDILESISSSNTPVAMMSESIIPMIAPDILSN